jgi:hypothetical protein
MTGEISVYSIILSIEINDNNHAEPAIVVISICSAKVICWPSQDFIFLTDHETVNCGFSRRGLFKIKS